METPILVDMVARDYSSGIRVHGGPSGGYLYTLGYPV